MAGQEIERAANFLGRAYGEGELSDGSRQALAAVANVGVELDRTLGVDGKSDDLLLVTILVDDSGSIAGIPGGADAVQLGHNSCLEALEKVEGSEILVHTRYLNSGTLSPYRELSDAVRLHAGNYSPTAYETPLYKQSVLALGAAMAKVRQQGEQGRRARAFTLLVTDGANYASNSSITAHDVRFLVQDMLEFSDDYIVASMGIGSPDYFHQVFTDMGIPNGWILTPGATPESILDIFRDKVARSLQLAAGGGDAGWYQLEAGPVSGDA